MNALVIEKNEIENSQVTISDQRFLHLTEVVKVGLGDELKLTIIDKGLSTGKIIHIDHKSLVIQIGNIKQGLYFPIEFIIGASRPQTLKKVIEHGATQGISKFHIVQCSLSEKSYLKSKVLQEDQFKKLALLGISQSTVFYKLPEVVIHHSLEKLLKSITTRQRLILSPKTAQSASFENIVISDPSTFAIGPERGWTEAEVDLFKKYDFLEVAISPSILRVETALFSTMAHLNLKMI